MNFKFLIFNTCLFLCALVPLFFVHSYVFQDHLRHGMVEDGSVSQYAGDLLDSRSIIEKYQAVLESDGKANGRYRPGYYVYETFPFFLTLIKNGDFSFGMTGTEIKNHLNGDLQFHMLYLLVTVGTALWGGALLVRKVSGSMLYAVLFPLSVIFSASVESNITYNDTAEVPQLLAMAVYLIVFFFGEAAALHGRKNAYFYLVLATPVLFFLYLIKETTVVFLPVLLLYLVVSLLIRSCDTIYDKSSKKITLIYLLIHLFLNILLTLWVLLQVHLLKGGYATHYEIKSFQQLWEVFVDYSELFLIFPPIINLPVFGLIAVISITIFAGKNESVAIAKQGLYVIRAALFLIITACGFLAINLPWEYVSVRYMLPSFFLLGLTGAILTGFVDMRLQSIGGWCGTLPRIILLVLIVVWSYPAGAREYKRVAESYESEFGLHRIINVLTSDIIQSAKRAPALQYDILLDVGNMSYWMWIQTARIINREGALNVAVPGQKYPQERLYLKNTNGSKTIQLTSADGDGYTSRPYNIIYSAVSLSDAQKNEDKNDRLKKLDCCYIVDERWPVSVGSDNKWQIVKYLPRAE